jgi:hypothetical protein
MGYSTYDRMLSAYVSAAWAVDQYLGDRWRCAVD